MTAVAADYDNDGWPDIYVACDSTPSWLFRNQQDGTFRQEGARARRGAVARTGSSRRAWGSPSATTISTAASTSSRPTSPTTRTCSTATTARATSTTSRSARASASRPATSAGARGSSDLDNDGLPDLFLVTGQRLPGGGAAAARVSVPDAAAGLPQPRQRPLRGADRGSGQRRRRGAPSRGCAFGDFDNDGDVDVAGHEHERAAVAAAQRRHGRRPLAEGAARRREVEPQRDRRARDRALRRAERRRRR